MSIVDQAMNKIRERFPPHVNPDDDHFRTEVEDWLIGSHPYFVILHDSESGWYELTGGHTRWTIADIFREMVTGETNAFEMLIFEHASGVGSGKVIHVPQKRWKVDVTFSVRRRGMN